MDDYVTKLSRALPEGIAQASQGHVQPRASLHTRFDTRNISLADLTVPLGEEIVLVVEDINLRWMQVVGKALGTEVTPAFFAGHVREFTGDPWNTIMGATPKQSISELRKELYRSTCVEGDTSYWHLNGVSMSSRHAWQRPSQLRRLSVRNDRGLNIATRLSFWHSKHTGKLSFYCPDAMLNSKVLILVDAAATENPRKLHFPVSNNRGGLVMPWLYKDGSMYTCIHRFLSHPMYINALFSHQYGIPNHDSISPITFCYMLAVSTWREILFELDNTSEHISFVEIRKPTVAINDKLHDLRWKLNSLQKEVGRTLEWLPGDVQQELDRIKQHSSKYIPAVDEFLRRLLVDSAALEKFIMNSFKLLLSSISVQEAETSAKASQRAQQLTVLAFIFIPLSFVTSIFGMNVTEINGSLISASVPAATLVVTLTSTAIAFFVLHLWQQHKKKQR